MAAPYATRYAHALLGVLESSGADIAAATRELDDFADAWRESAPLREVFLDPSVPAVQKVAVIDRLREPLGLSGPVRNFLAVIVNHGRMDGLEAILELFRGLARGDLHIARVEWTTARPVSEDERHTIEWRLGELTGGPVEATFREDPALLGGARLRVGSMVYDGSVRGRLDGLREKLMADHGASEHPRSTL